MNGPLLQDDPEAWKRLENELRKWPFWPRTGFGSFRPIVHNNRLKQVEEGGMWLRPG